MSSRKEPSELAKVDLKVPFRIDTSADSDSDRPSSLDFCSQPIPNMPTYLTHDVSPDSGGFEAWTRCSQERLLYYYDRMFIDLEFFDQIKSKGNPKIQKKNILSEGCDA